MKQVTFVGRTSGKPTGGVQVGPLFYPTDTPVIVANHDADALKDLEGFEFQIKEAPKGSRTTKQATTTDEDQPGVTGGFGGSGPSDNETTSSEDEE